MQSLKELQEQACSAYDRRKFCTYDVEFMGADMKQRKVVFCVYFHGVQLW